MNEIAQDNDGAAAQVVGTIDLGEYLEVSQGEQLKHTLGHYLAGYQQLVIDGGQLNAVDTASLQTLCVFVQAAKSNGIGISWRVSDALLKVVDILAMQTALQID